LQKEKVKDVKINKADNNLTIKENFSEENL